MKASGFVEKYIKLAPTDRELKKIGVSDRFIQEEKSRFDIIRVGNKKYPNCLWDLVTSYNVEKVNISDIRLGLKTRETPSYYYVGIFEDNERLVIEKNSGLVKILDSESDGELFQCAADAGRFLEVLLVLAEYFISCMINKELYEDLN